MSRVVWYAEGSPSGSLTTWNDSTSRCPERSQPPVAGLVVLQRPAVMPSAMMPQSVGASRAKMRSDSRFPISRGDYTLADLVMAADDGDWRLYWSAPWYVVGPPLDNLVVIRQTVGPPSPLRASIL